MLFNKIKRTFRGFICIFIYSRSLRHIVRDGYFFQYIKNYFIIRKDIKREKSLKFQYQLSICACVKNEAKYIKEWIEFHKIVGVEHFYIYDNESNDGIKNILLPYIQSGIVDYLYWNGKGQQRNMYNDCLLKHKYETKWMGFIDIDEFVVPISKKTIPEILNDYDGYAGLSVHWVMYGDGGHKKEGNDLVIDRFRKRASDNFERNMEVKSIINPRFCVGMDAHKPYVYLNYCSVDENYRKIYSHKNNPFTINKIRINHYFCKSWEEYLNKQKRGDVILGELKHNKKLWFDYNNRNDVEDFIMKPYISLVKKSLKN